LSQCGKKNAQKKTIIEILKMKRFEYKRDKKMFKNDVNIFILSTKMTYTNPYNAYQSFEWAECRVDYNTNKPELWIGRFMTALFGTRLFMWISYHTLHSCCNNPFGVLVTVTTNWRSSFTATLGHDVYWLLHNSRMSLLHNTTHAYIGETNNERQFSVTVI